MQQVRGNGSHTTCHWSAIVGPKLYLVAFSSYLTWKNVVTLRGHSRSLEI